MGLTDGNCRAIDDLTLFETDKIVGHQSAPARYAVRQAMEQAYQRYAQTRNIDARQARSYSGVQNLVQSDRPADPLGDIVFPSSKPSGVSSTVNRDFFGRAIETSTSTFDLQRNAGSKGTLGGGLDCVAGSGKIWVSFHEGFSNAVRKPVSLAGLMKDF